MMQLYTWRVVTTYGLILVLSCRRPKNAPNEKVPSEKVTAKSTERNAPNENAPKYI